MGQPEESLPNPRWLDVGEDPWHWWGNLLGSENTEGILHMPEITREDIESDEYE